MRIIVQYYKSIRHCVHMFQRSRPAPVIIPQDVKPALEFLADAQTRKTIGIGVDSKWLFPSQGKTRIVNQYGSKIQQNCLFTLFNFMQNTIVTKRFLWMDMNFVKIPSESFVVIQEQLEQFSGTGSVRCYSSLKKTCNEICLKAPSRINSVSMRKYIATMTQVGDIHRYNNYPMSVKSLYGECENRLIWRYPHNFLYIILYFLSILYICRYMFLNNFPLCRDVNFVLLSCTHRTNDIFFLQRTFVLPYFYIFSLYSFYLGWIYRPGHLLSWIY